MQELRELARQLLADGTVGVVIGYEEGPRGLRPAFITRPEDAARLVFDHRAVHNLATYLNPRRPQLRRLGKAAVVVKGCDARALAGLLRETQLKREEVVVIGIRCSGVAGSPEETAALSAENLAPRCAACTHPVPTLVDHLLGEERPIPGGGHALDQRVAELMAMTPEERFAFWSAELSRCVRCHACREVCPLCFCERCLADKSQPQWIESSPHPRGNLAWQINRQLHLAGRCVGCGECERACPVGIPLTLISHRLAQVALERFGYQASDDPAVPAPIGTWRSDDPQEFIL